MTCVAATASSYSGVADPIHARRAVAKALSKSGHHSANGVVLFLTPGYHDPTPAIREASRAAGCLQIIGCHGDTLLTEDEWLLDVEGAVALVVHGPIQFSHHANPPLPSLDFCSPDSISASWLDSPAPRFGAVASSMYVDGPFDVWSAARKSEQGHAEIFIHGCRSAVGVSQGVRPLTPPVAVRKTDGFQVLKIGRYPALNVLSQAIPRQYREAESPEVSCEMLMGGVTFGDPDTAIESGRYQLNQVVAANRENGSITLSDMLNPGERLFLAIRDRLAAERDMINRLNDLSQNLGHEPSFSFLLPCVTRNPVFTGNEDHTLNILKERYPKLPVIGFYGHGQISPLETGSHLYYHSTGIGLYSASASG